MAPASMSFEAQIGLALQGSNWQELQNSNSISVPTQTEAVVQEGIFLENEANLPPEMTTKQKKKRERFERTIARDTGDVLQLIEPESIMPVEQNITWDQDPELICSYNWQASTDDTNTIFVPGEPAKWQTQALPHTLQPDSGFSYADYNYARQPRTPYEPMFQAMSIMNPNYQFMDVDVLADRNNLRVLLEFVQGKANGPFRLDLYSIFNTLVIVRNEGRWWKLSDGKSYGFNFERFFTRSAEGMEDATSHYRAIRYPIGPLNVVVRFEADAYDDGVASDELTPSETEAVSGGLAERPSFRYSAPIRVLQKGHIVPASQMVELKTQVHRVENYSAVSCQDQLWFGRTSLLYTAPYERGTGVVQRIVFEDATARIKKWEDRNQENLRKLAGLLSMLKAIMKAERRPNRAVVLVREDKAGPLTVRSMESMNRAVGREAFQRHWRREPTGQQFGGHRGQRGGGRGYHTVSRGQGDLRGGRGNHTVPRGRGDSNRGRGNNTVSRGRGHADNGRGGSNTAHVTNSNPGSGDIRRGRGEQSRRPNS